MVKQRSMFSEGRAGNPVFFLTVALTQRDNLILSNYFPDMEKYRSTREDLKRFNKDPGGSLLYENGVSIS